MHQAAHGDEPIVRCAWCDGVQVGDEWRRLTRARRLFQAVVGRPVDETETRWRICPDCLSHDFPEVDGRLLFA